MQVIIFFYDEAWFHHSVFVNSQVRESRNPINNLQEL
jgi:hypothetical protein